MIGPEWARDMTEVGSDVLGLASAAVLAIPFYRTVQLRRNIEEARQIVIDSKANNQDELLAELQHEVLRLAEYDDKEARYINRGLLLLAISFVLRLAYHALSKL